MQNADNSPKQSLKHGARCLKIALSESQTEQLMGYLQLLQRWNQTHNLTAVPSVDAMITEHVLDSLSAMQVLNGARICDAGAGAGLPGLVLAIALPERHFSLIELRRKRCSFMQSVCAALGINNAAVVRGRAEQHIAALRPTTLISRAVHDFATLCHKWLHLLEPRCRLIGLCGIHDPWQKKWPTMCPHTSIDRVCCIKPQHPYLAKKHRILMIDAL